MQSIFDYLDYRRYLLDFYEWQKKKHPHFSYRYMSGKIGLDAGYLVKILQDKLHVPEKYVDAFCTLCKFSEKEEAYFRTLINFIINPIHIIIRIWTAIIVFKPVIVLGLVGAFVKLVGNGISIRVDVLFGRGGRSRHATGGLDRQHKEGQDKANP